MNASKDVNAINNKFTLEEASADTQDIITIYGLKGAGKTTMSMLLTHPDSITGISFDKKTLRCKNNFYKDRDIAVYDCSQYLRNSMDEYRDTAVKCYDYTEYVLDQCAVRDWVLMDGGEIMSKLCEQKMRKEHDLKPFQGFSQLTWWNERNMFLRTLHDLAKNKARKGVIYTIFSQMQEVEDFLGGVKTKEVPRWMDAATWETDVVLHAFSHIDDRKHSRRFSMEVTSSKILKYPTGKVFDLTDMYYEFNPSSTEVHKFSDDFLKIVEWYVRRGADRSKLIAYLQQNSSLDGIDESKFTAMAVQHKEHSNLLEQFLSTVNA